MLSFLTDMLSFTAAFVHLSRRRRYTKVNLFEKTEQHIAQLLPDDISQSEFDSIDRATSLGLFPMEGGWMAGGYIAKLAVKRLRSEWSAEDKKASARRSPQLTRMLAEELEKIDPGVPVDTLLRIRTDLVRRGLLE